MSQKSNTDRYLKAVRESLSKAMESRRNGKKELANGYLIDACVGMLLYAKERGPSSEEYNLSQARKILDELIISSGGKADKKSSSESTAWKALAELGIEKPVIPSTSMEDVVGLEDAKREIVEKLIYPVKYRDLSAKYGVRPSGGVLLYGPPGTGKTFLARAVANEAGAAFINVDPSKLYNQWFGEFEKNINRLFDAARQLSPCVLFFDEIEALAPRRGMGHTEQVSRRGVSQLLIEMEGIEKRPDEDIFLLAASNRPWDIDDALLRPGRFDTRIHVGLPELKARQKIFKVYLRKAEHISQADYAALARDSEGYSGADISYVCRRTAAKLLARSIEQGAELSMDFASVKETLNEVKPSVSPSVIDQYNRYLSSG